MNNPAKKRTVKPSLSSLHFVAATMLVLCAGLTTAPGAETLIPRGAVWKYLDDGSDQGTTWRAAGFNDSFWASGPAELGYGDNDEATVVNGGPNGNRFPTTYFRRAFDVANPSAFTVVRLAVKRDDGVIVYLNGVEIFRDNMRPGPADFDDFAAGNASDDGRDFLAPVTVDPARFVTGVNVIAVEMHQDTANSSDISFNLELTASTDNTPPVVALTSPLDGRTYTAPADITLRADATDVEGNLAGVEFYVNGALQSTDTTSPYTGSISAAGIGSYAIYAVAFDTLGLRSTTPVVNIGVLASMPPTVVGRTPAPGAVNALTRINVTFSEPVSGVRAADLLINGTPAAGVTGAGTNYSFTLAQPPDGFVVVAWDGRVNIIDYEPSPRSFDPYSPGASWQYTLADTVPPVAARVMPAPGATIRALNQIEVTFSEPVTGVDPADLRVNNVAATSVSGTGAGPYRFEFVQPANGAMTVTWTAGHGIRDLATTLNAFGGAGWSYTLNTNAIFGGAIVINEIMYHPSSEQPADEWIELFNRGTATVNLAGWAFTRGVNYTFTNVTIPAGGYLAVAADVATFRARYPSVTAVVGGWAGQLSNTGEDIELEDASGDRVDLIEYFDEGDFALRRRPAGRTFGWDWFAEHDGLGKSLELRNAALSDDSGQNWGSSTTVEGTPGRVNSLASTNLAPIIRDVSHAPAVPRSTDPIVVTARILDEAPAAGLQVRVWWRNASTTNPPAFSSITMLDDGGHGDGLSGDGVFGGTVPAQTDKTVVEFYVEAVDGGSRTRTWPAMVEDTGGVLAQAANAHVQVDNTIYDGRQPTYRIVMTESDRTAFATQNRNTEVLINGTLVAIESGATQIRYNVGMRYRGAGSRGRNPPTYRLNIPADRRWDGRTALNLNSQSVNAQVVGSQVAIQAGLVTEYAKAVQLRLNGVNPANAGSSQFGSYSAVEPTGGEMVENHLPDDGSGNVYRASSSGHTANLNYLGTDPTLYQSAGYQKNSNASENDWTDLFSLTFALDPATTPDNEYVAAVRRNLNVEQWLRYFAVCSIMEYTETALSSGSGDDYGLYRGIADPRFIVLAHDFDTIFGQGDAAGNINESIYVAGALGTINRLLRHPTFEPMYHAELRRQLAGAFATNRLFSVIDQYLGDWVPAQTIQSMKTFIAARNTNVLFQLPPEPIAPVATIDGTPASPTYLVSTTLLVGGQGITHYRYRLNGGAFGPETPVATPIALSGLTNGAYTVYVIGRDAAQNWQVESAATVSDTWFVLGGLRQVKINEVLARNASAFNHSGTFPDAIELFNPRASAVDLTGWRLTDDREAPNKFVFPAGISLPAGGYLVVFANNPDGTAGLHLGFGLNQDGDTLFLLEPAAVGGRVVDAVEFGFQLPNLSIGREPGGHWALCVPTLGALNAPIPTGSQSALRINEWLANGASPFVDDFIELYNPTALPVEIGELYLTDRLIGLATQHRITPLSFLPAFSYRAFWADNNPDAGTDHLNFQLAAEKGEIGLLGPGGRVIDSVIYGPQQPGQSEGRVPNGGDRIEVLSAPTPSAPNPVPPPPITPQVVNLLPLDGVFQWKYDDSGTDLGSAWIAPGYNDGAWKAGPAAFGFEDNLPNPPEPIRTTIAVTNNRITFYFRARFTVPAGLNLSGLQATHETDDGAVFYLNGVEAGRFNMPAAPAVITNRTLASSSHEANILETTSLSFASLVTGQNVIAVELHQNAGTSSDAMFGMRLDALVITNGPSAAGVRINEILANSQTVTNADGSVTDWVELHNPSNGAVDLAGMSLTDQVSDPRRWVFPAGSVVPAAGYLIVRFDPLSLPSTNMAAVLQTGFGLSAAGDEVYLFNRPADGGGLLDSVAFGVQAVDYAIGRVPDSGSNWGLTLPTQGARNIAATVAGTAGLTFNEWLANPASGEDWFELHNGAAQPVALGGLRLTDDLNDPGKSPIAALSFIGTGLQGFQRFEADNNPGAGGNHVSFRLGASGETIALTAPSGAIIASITFGPQAEGVSEGRLPDGTATIARFPTSASPGEANYAVLRNVVVNEALSHTDAPLEDAVEFFNPSGQGVDLSGWYLSDRRSESRLFRIPDGTVLGPGAFVVFYEYQFNPDFSGQFPSFALDSTDGDEVILWQVDGTGALTGYRAAARFGAAQNGVSFGRLPTSHGPDFTAMSRRTFGSDAPGDLVEFRTGRGASNGLPYVGPVVVSEIMYHPPDIYGVDNEFKEYIELRNVTNVTVSLYDPAFPANTWRLRDAVDYEFPTGANLLPGGQLVVVGFDPSDAGALATFRQHYQIGINVAVYGPWRGRLQDSSDNVELYKPDAPQPPGTPKAGFVPYILADRVRYTDSMPWPILADGSTNGIGYSLSRRVAAAYGNEATNWVATAPTPGSTNVGGVLTPPSIQSISAAQAVTAGATVNLVASAFGSGLRFQWALDGTPLAGATNLTLSITGFQAANAGIYSIVAVNNGGAASAATRVDLRAIPTITRQPVNVGAGIGQSALLSVVAAGTPPLSYQWQRNNVNVAGGTGATLVINNAQPANEGSYRVIITNAFGTATSSVATLIVQTPPSISQQPQGGEVLAGAAFTFTVQASGTAPLRYQWQKDGANLPNATNATFSLPSTRLVDSGFYRVLVSNFVGTILSQAANLTVSQPPTISIQATDAAAGESGGNTGQFTINRAGVLGIPLQVNFLVSGTATPGGDYQTLTSPGSIPAGSNAVVVTVTPNNDSVFEGTETIIVTLQSGVNYVLGSPASATVLLTDDDNLPPVVALTSPNNGAVYASTSTISVAATASDPENGALLVEFFLNGTTRIGQATTAPYGVTLNPLPAGTYTLTAVATDPLGAFTVSAPVTIVVNAPPTVSIATPSAGAVFDPPANINVIIAASDSDGTIARVELYSGDTLLSTLTSAPYTYAWLNVAAGEYALTARATDNQGATTVSSVTPVTVAVPTPTFADVFAARGLVTGFTNRVRGTNSTFTRETGEPRHENRSGAKSAWISWAAPASGPVTMNTFGSSFDTVLSVYTGSVVTNLARIVGNDDANDQMVQSALTFDAVGGVVYQIAVDGFSATAGGVIDFSLSLPDFRPRIATPPQSLTVNQGASATFTVTASGTGPFTYRWRFNNANINNATNATFTRNSAQPNHEGAYTVVVSNPYGGVTSVPAILTVRALPVITAPPVSVAVGPGEDAAFSVSATGFAPLGYQWRYGGANLPGATDATLSLSGIQASQEGYYTVVVSNLVGSVTSAPAALIVLDGLVRYEVFELIPIAGIWRYDQSGTDLGAAWRASTFDDSAWPLGGALLGFEDSTPFPYPAPIVTPLTAPDRGGPITVYFRTRFQYTNTLLHSAVTLLSESMVDDGAVYYLNGVESARLRMSANATNFSSLAQQAPENPTTIVLAPGALVTGNNTLAVEVHQNASTSSDVVFGLSLTAYVATTNQPVILSAEHRPGGIAVTLGGIPGRTYALDSAPSVSGAWTPLVTFSDFTGQATFTNAPGGTRFYRGRLVK